MTTSHLLQTLRGTAAANRSQMAGLIESLSRSVALLTIEIEHEEARAGVRDQSAVTYPVLARTLRARKDNIRITIASLEEQFHATNAA
jgi:hypothetical protein